MNIRVKLFAVARQLAGSDELEIALPAGATVAQLRQAVAAASPPLAGIAAQVMVAVDQQYASDKTLISESADVALIPPVSGG